MKNFIKKLILPYKFYHYNPYITFIINNPNKSFILHLFYMFICNIKFLFKSNISINKYTYSFYKNGFFKKKLVSNDFFYEVFNFLNLDIINKNRKVIFCHLDNFTYEQKNYFTNKSQIHVYKVPENILLKCDNRIRNDKIFDNIIKSYFRSNYRITNLRIWKYLKINNKELLNKVGCHFDMFPHKTLKIMIYKGFFSKENGALDVINPNNNNVIYSVKGLDPIILIDTNHLYHQAKLPLFDRDTIEITLQPTFSDTKPLQGGFSAGHPINPFKKNSLKEFSLNN
jgi:hypothetical protein